MRQSEGKSNHWRVICETTLDALLVVDDDRRYVDVNEPAERLLAAPRDKILSRRLQDFTPQEHWSLLDTLWAQLQEEGTSEGLYEVLRGDGVRAMVEYRATWEFGEDRHLIAARELGVRRLGLHDAGPWGKNVPRALTPREQEILQQAADGKTVPEIAETLFLSQGTVKTHLANAYRKLGVGDRTAAVAECLRRGLIE